MQDTCALGGNPRPNAGSGPARREESSGRYQELRQLKGGKQFYTIKEVVSTGLCSRQTLWRLMKSGELGYVKVGTRVLIPRSELISFVQTQAAGMALTRGRPMRSPAPPSSCRSRWAHLPRNPTRDKRPKIHVWPLGGTTLAQASRGSRHP